MAVPAPSLTEAALAGAVTAENQLPAGFDRIPDVIYRGGPVDLASAAAFELDPNIATEILNAVGFRQGYSRSWEDPRSGAIVDLLVYELVHEPASSGYKQLSRIALVGLFDSLAVPSIPGGAGFIGRIEQFGVSVDVSSALFVVDNLYAQITVSTLAGDFDSAPDVETIAAAFQANLAELVAVRDG